MRPLLGVLLGTALLAGTATAASADHCAAGRAEVRRAPARAWLHLTLCERGGTDVAAELSALAPTLYGGPFAEVTVMVEPAGAEAAVDTLGGVRFPTPLTIWLPFGAHEITAVAPAHHGVMRRVMIDTEEPFELSFRLDPAAPTGGGAAAVDFGDEGAVGEMTTADTLPAVERETLLPRRFRGGGVGYEEDLRASRVAFGAAAALSRSDLSDEGGDARLGFGAAALLSYRVRGGITLQPELGFALRGEDGAGLSYVTLSVLGGYRHRLGGMWVHGGLGPMLGLALSGEVRGRDVTPLEASAAAVAGVLVPAGRGRALIDVRADLGLTTVDESSVRNRALSLRLGYLF